jgi:CheY-like chemotaxis protein
MIKHTPVLIVDDSLMITKIIKKALLTNTTEYYHFVEDEIFIASDGMQAFEVMGKHPYIKLIISDINMPNLNGDEFIEILNDTDKLKNLEVVFITSATTKLFLKTSIKESILGVIYKPFKHNSFNSQLKLLKDKKSEYEVELKRINKLHIKQKEHIEKATIKYLSLFNLEINEKLLNTFIEENFGSEEVCRSDFEEITHSILSSYFFNIQSTHKINPKKILCILKSIDKKPILSKNRLGLIDGFKSQITYVNSNELALKNVLDELTTPLQDKIGIAFTKVKKFPKLNIKLFAVHFEFIEKELIKLDCDFIDYELKKLLLELKELTIFSKWMYNFLKKEELYASVDIVKKSVPLKSEVTKRLSRSYQHSLVLSQHYCGKIEFDLWKKAKESAEIIKYLKTYMPNTIANSLRFLLHKNKITKEVQKEYLPYEQEKVIVMSNDLTTLKFFKEINKTPFDKWDFFCCAKQSLLDVWIKSNKPDKLIIDYNFSGSVVDNGIKFIKILMKKHPILEDLIKHDQLYIIANDDKLLELSKHKETLSFAVIQEPLGLKNIFENLLYQ